MYATSKNTVSTPKTKPTTYSCPIVSASKAYAIGIDASSAARPRSPTMRIGPPRQPVDPDARRQADEDERRELDDAQQRHLERAGVERDDRDERDREPPRPASRPG